MLLLKKQLEDDLDWIVLKALDPNRHQRYESASFFARDISRFLSNEPIEARPQATSYRFRKFVKKNFAAVITSAAFALLLASATALSVWQARNARTAYLAELEQKTILEEMLEFTFGMLSSPLPEEQGRSINFVDLMLSKKPEIVAAFHDHPETVSYTHLTLPTKA